MTYETISGYVRAKPFVPFALHLTDGRVVTIDAPKHTMWSLDRRRFVFNDVGAHLLYMDLESIARVELLDTENSVPS
jgi:hypothetical protein